MDNGLMRRCLSVLGGVIFVLAHPAIAAAQWQEDAVMRDPIDGVYPQLPMLYQPIPDRYPQLPMLYQPIPDRYLQLGKQLETLKARWQSTQLTNYAQSQAYATGMGSKTMATLDPAIAAKLQHRIDTYYEFLELREFAFAELEIQAIYRLVGEQYLQNKPQAEAEIRAVWLDRGALVAAKDEAGLAVLFDRLAMAGINLVFLETVNASYTIFPSQVAPKQNPKLVGWDPLASAIKLAHARQMELHAWTWIFAAANQAHNELMGQSSDYLGPVLSQHPDWGAGDRRGNLFQAGSRKAFFDPANPEVQQYLLDLLTEIATKYDVDGIQLDYIRYPFEAIARNQVYGFGDAARSQFRKQGYPDPLTMGVGDRHWKAWQAFRVAQIDEFVKKASTTLRQKRPDLLLSAAVFAIPRDRRLEQIQQNWEAWIKAGYLDLLVPMTYAEDTPELSQLTSDLMATFPETGTLLVPSVRLLNLDAGAAIDQQQLLRHLPTAGTAFFAASDLTADLAENLNAQNNVSLLPQRDPLGAIANRFETLQREWQLTFPKQPWQPEAAAVSTALKTAQANPSTENILLLQTQWVNFLDAIQPQLHTYEKQNAYQVQAWKNRLTAIEQLLNYGDRRSSLLP